MKRTPLVRKTRLKSGTTKLSPNPARQARRRKRTAELHRTPEYRDVRTEAMERAGGRCEYVEKVRADTVFGRQTREIRCTVVDTDEEPLHCHLESYGAVGKLKAKRAKMYCYRHHMLVESQLRPQNQGKLGR